MRALVMMAVWFVSVAAVADDGVFSAGRCRNLAPAEEARLRTVDGRLTAQAALAAERELHARMAAKLTDPARREPTSKTLVVTLEGWLLKKEWLAARARREHDADEAGDYCEFLRREAGLPP